MSSCSSCAWTYCLRFEISDFQVEKSARELDSCNKKLEERARLEVQDCNSYIFRL